MATGKISAVATGCDRVPKEELENQLQLHDLVSDAIQTPILIDGNGKANSSRSGVRYCVYYEAAKTPISIPLDGMVYACFRPVWCFRLTETHMLMRFGIVLRTIKHAGWARQFYAHSCVLMLQAGRFGELVMFAFADNWCLCTRLSCSGWPQLARLVRAACAPFFCPNSNSFRLDRNVSDIPALVGYGSSIQLCYIHSTYIQYFPTAYFCMCKRAERARAHTHM